MRRFIRYDQLGNQIGEVLANDVFSMVRREEINGEHSLEITTTQILEKNERILYKDGRGVWREYVVAGVDEEHAARRRIVGTYYCVWSMQQDLQGVIVSVMPGTRNPVQAGTALSALLSAQARWTLGTVTETSWGGASMYDMTAWAAMGVLVENWGGELDTTITVSSTNVLTRKVDLYSKQGSQTAKRRFDFGADLSSVKRVFADEPYYCRISPRGKGEESGEGYGRKITIESVNDGKDYLEYAPMVDVAKMPNGNSGYIYPTKIVENSDCETPQELLDWAQAHLEEFCTPKVTYEVDAIQLGIEGVDVTGVSLGELVHVVDSTFIDGGLRLQGRIVAMTVDELNEREISITIGDITDTLASKISMSAQAFEAVNELQQSLTTAEYIQSLLDRINAEINATGGYTYITEGQGIRTYDVAVSDPTIGREASQVVEVKGGSIRIANSKTAQGEWDWRSVFQAGMIATDVLNATNIITGCIRDGQEATTPGTGSYWDLDNGNLSMKGDFTLTKGTGSSRYDAALGSFTLPSTNPGVLAGTYDGLSIENTNSSSLYGVYFVPRCQRPNTLDKFSLLGATHALRIVSDLDFSTAPGVDERYASIDVDAANAIEIGGGSTQGAAKVWIGTAGSGSTGIGHFYVFAQKYGLYSTNYLEIQTSTTTAPKDGRILTVGNFDHVGGFVVSGTKSRVIETDSYSDRLLYCYETPSPMFGDIGEGVTDEDGYCVVSIDDVFGETVRTDIAYYVFLQVRGNGAVYVDEKKRDCFIVRGTPNMAFDWEVKAVQIDCVNVRLEDKAVDSAMLEERGFGAEVPDLYEDEYAFIAEQERVLYETA